MDKLRLQIIIAIFLCFFNMFFTNGYSYEDKIVLTTIPKSGTHLIIKLFVLMKNKNPCIVPGQIGYNQNFQFYQKHDDYQGMYQQFLSVLNDSLSKNEFPVIHTNLAEPLLEYLSSTDNEIKKFIMIRDLRDVIVSAAFYHHETIEKYIGPSTIEQKITYLMELKDDDSDRFIVVVQKYAQKALKLMKNDSFFICRYEDLVGEKGGGSQELQGCTIKAIANYLNLSMGEDELKMITEQLFGNEMGPQISVTFNDGQIGKWRKYFTKEHHRIFKQRMGNLQLLLGYTLDE